MAAKTIKSAPPVVESTEPTIKDLLGLSAVANPTQPAEGMLPSDFLRLLGGGHRRYFRVQVDVDWGQDMWVEYRDSTFWTASRDPMIFDKWCLQFFHGSPARPAVRISPISYQRMATVAPLNDCAVIWASFDVELDKENQQRRHLPFPAIVAASRDRIRKKIAEFEVPVWGVLDGGSEIVAIWRLGELINPEYAAILTDKIALLTGARRLNIRSSGPERAMVSMLAQKGNFTGADQMRAGVVTDERRRALTEVLWPLPGAAAKVSPRHLIDCTPLADSTAAVKVETLARWAMPPQP